METRLSTKGLKLVSHGIISSFAVLSLIFFSISVDYTAQVEILSIVLLIFALYRLWQSDEWDFISLLLFFFGTSACFNFFDEAMIGQIARLISVGVFAALSLIITNYLLNMIKPYQGKEKAIYKLSLAIIFTEIFWVLSFLNASPVAKGAITAVIFFSLQLIVRDILEKKYDKNLFVFLLVLTIICLTIIVIMI